MDHQYIMDIALPYLGTVAGYYTDWTPLKNRQLLFSEQLDLADPWQFINIRVN
jgi:homospermidine synthase